MSRTTAEDARDAMRAVVQPSHAGEVAEVVKVAVLFADAPLAAWLSDALQALEELFGQQQLSRVVTNEKDPKEPRTKHRTT